MANILKNIETAITEEREAAATNFKKLLEAVSTTENKLPVCEAITGLLGQVMLQIDKITASKNNLANRQQMMDTGDANITKVASIDAIANAAALAGVIANINALNIPPAQKQRYVQLFQRFPDKGPYSDGALDMLHNMVAALQQAVPDLARNRDQWASALQSSLEAFQQGNYEQYDQMLQRLRRQIAKVRLTAADAVASLSSEQKLTR